MVSEAAVHGICFSTVSISPHTTQTRGSFLNPKGKGMERRATARWLFDNILARPHPNQSGVFRGLVSLGCPPELSGLWEENTKHVMSLLEVHFSSHDFLLGGRPSLADFGFIAPFYAHLWNDVSIAACAICPSTISISPHPKQPSPYRGQC